MVEPPAQLETSRPMLRALIVHPDDSVANLIGPGKRGQRVQCTVEGVDGTEVIGLLDDLPSNHKLARRDIEAGAPVIKYGLPIGKASRSIRRGEHVHTHNIESNRGRGDLPNDSARTAESRSERSAIEMRRDGSGTASVRATESPLP